MMYWKIKYTDGTEVHQNMESVTYESLDRERIAAASIIDKDDNIVCSLLFDLGDSLVYRRRVRVTPGVGEEICHLLAKRKDKESQKVIFCFESDGKVHTLNTFNEDHPWFYSPNFRPYE